MEWKLITTTQTNILLKIQKAIHTPAQLMQMITTQQITQAIKILDTIPVKKTSHSRSLYQLTYIQTNMVDI